MLTTYTSTSHPNIKVNFQFTLTSFQTGLSSLSTALVFFFSPVRKNDKAMIYIPFFKYLIPKHFEV